MKKIPPLTKKRRSLAELTPDSLAAALYHRELAEQIPDGVDLRHQEIMKHDENNRLYRDLR